MWSTGINRNIVECKVFHRPFVKINKAVLIETLWNVKFVYRLHITFYGFIVLIETLWNVKRKNKVGYSLPFSVLIETLWNVKIFRQASESDIVVSINRNIVECKD